jgi:hypothetical protein
MIAASTITARQAAKNAFTESPSLLHALLLLVLQGYRGPQEQDDQNTECNIIEGCHGTARPGGHVQHPL